jgi:hypothetical protein
MDTGVYLAGAAEAKITPPVGIPLLGPQAPSTGVHDELFARALVLSDGHERVALVCLDLVGLDFRLADDMRDAIRRRTDIGASLLNCSHTHSAPFTIPWSYQGWEDFERHWSAWRRDLLVAVTEAVARAAADLQDAALSAGREPVRIGLNRRSAQPAGVVMQPNAEGPTVGWVDVLRVDEAGGEPLAVLLSHAAHPVLVHASSSLISADYPGYATAAVRERLGEGVVAMFAQGCGANINAEPLRGGFEAARQAGEALGEAAVRAAARAHDLPPSRLGLSTQRLSLPLQDYPSVASCEEALERACTALAAAQADGDRATVRLWSLRDHVLCLEDLLAKVRSGRIGQLRFEVSALTLGEHWCLLALTHEVFCEYQLWVEEMHPCRHNMVWAYTNGCESYLSTDESLALGPLGGYEAAPSPVVAAGLCYRARLAPRAGIEQQVREGIRKALEADGGSLSGRGVA